MCFSHQLLKMTSVARFMTCSNDCMYFIQVFKRLWTLETYLGYLFRIACF